jgi:hypothetical protein
MKNLIQNSRLLIVLFFMFSVNISFADINNSQAVYTVYSTASGTWSEASNWSGSTPDPEVDRCNITIYHDIVYNPGSDPWTWRNNNTLTIKSGASLTINANFITTRNFNLVVEAGGQLIINGYFFTYRNFDALVDGGIYIHDFFYVWYGGNGSVEGSGEIIADGEIYDYSGRVESNLILGIERWLAVDNGDWDINTSWTGSQGGTTALTPPNHQCIVYIENGYNVSVNVDTQIKSLYLQDGANLEVDAGKTLTVTDNASISGTFKLKSDASGTAGFIYNGSNDIAAKCEKYISANEYHYVTSPMTSAPVSSYNKTSSGQTNPNFYSFDEAETNSDWAYAWRQETTGNLEAGKGYAIFTNENYSHSLEGGTLINQDFTYTISNTNSAGGSKSWNLIGNPFPCNIDADKLIDENDDNSVFTGALYFWDDDATGGSDYNSSDYLVYTKGGGTSGGNGRTHNGIIAPMQAFFVQADAGGDFNFTNNIKTENQASFVKNVEEESSYYMQIFRMSAQTSEGLYNDILIKFANDASEDIDLYDGLKLKGNNYMAFYTLFKKHEFAIQGLPLLMNSTSIELGIDAHIDTEYTFKAEEIINLSNDIKIYLEDRHTKAWIDLREKEYTVQLNGISKGRFTLHFQLDKKGNTTEIEEITNDIKIYSSENKVYINGIVGTADYSVYDITGKLVKAGIIKDSHEVITMNISPGYYVVSVKTNDSVFSNKIFIE